MSIDRKTCIQIGLQTTCEYRFLAEPEYEKRRHYAPWQYPLLPDDFDESGEWYYYGIDCHLRPFPHPRVGDASLILQRKITAESPNTLKDFTDEYSIERIHLLAIDIEGWEHRILETLSECPPIDYLICEYHPAETIDAQFARNPNCPDKLNKVFEGKLLPLDTFIETAASIGFTLENQFSAG